MIEQSALIDIGKIFKPHSYKGELKVEIDFSPDLFYDKKIPVFIKIDNLLVPFFVDKVRGSKNSINFIKLKGIDSDTEASKLSNHNLYALKSSVSEFLGIKTEDLEKTDDDLLGYKVMDRNTGNEVGVLKDWEEGKEYDYMIVENKEGQIHTIPFVEDYIIDIADTKENTTGEIIVDLPDGFLEFN